MGEGMGGVGSGRRHGRAAAVSMSVTRSARVARALAIAIGLVCACSGVWAQETAPPARMPEGPFPVLDCAPPMPAPPESCVLRVPPGNLRTDLSAGAAEAGQPDPKFGIFRSANPEFPAGLSMSETLLLVDLTPGPRNGRAATFEREKALLRRFVEALPAGEPVALYGFHEAVERIVPFDADRAALLEGIAGLRLKGNNTMISSNAQRTIEALADRDATILRNLVLVSDGDEDEIGTADEIVNAASKARVSVSTLAMIWRPAGVAANAPGADFLRRVAERTSGSFQRLDLRDEGASVEGVKAFSDSFNGPLNDSGLIVPDGEPKTAIISVTLSQPVLGSPGTLSEKAYTVRFTPETASAPGAPSSAPPAAPAQDGPPAEARVLGYPAWQVASAVGGASTMLLVAAFLLIGRRRRAGAPEAPEPLPVPEGPVGDTVFVQRGERPSTPPLAFLLPTSGGRIAVTSERAEIGRGRNMAIHLADGSGSRAHAELKRDGFGGFLVADMGSLNGTWVNGKRITQAQRLADGDVLRFGEVEARFVVA